jgi:hypothetical protein
MSDRWVAIDVDYFRNPKALAAGTHGRALHLASICHSGDVRSDGHITPEALGVVLAYAGAPRRAVSLVVAAGLWVPNGSGWVIHDYLRHQESREEALAAIERARAGGRERQKRWRDRHREP